MYPFVRLIKEVWKASRQPALGLFDTHLSHHICWPWDIDPWMELNNGRTLTLYDLGRVPLSIRTGFRRAVAGKGWGLAVAGSTIRYRKRVRAFDRVEIRSRCLGWDTRFLYMEQSMWRGADCTSHMLLRSAITSRAGIVNPAEAVRAVGHAGDSPALPAWAKAWISAEAERPWPPLM